MELVNKKKSLPEWRWGTPEEGADATEDPDKRDKGCINEEAGKQSPRQQYQRYVIRDEGDLRLKSEGSSVHKQAQPPSLLTTVKRTSHPSFGPKLPPHI